MGNTYCECDADTTEHFDAQGVCTECNKPSFHDTKLWKQAEAQQVIELEQSVNPHETEEELAKRLLKEALPRAAMSIAHLSAHSNNERIRLDAAKYIVERNMGKLGEYGNTEGDPWSEFLGDVVRENLQNKSAK